MTIFIAIVGLGILILVHELGHFVASLALGMRPRRFYIGFPPAILKTTRNGIEYGLGAIPLGGFVKIPGMHRPAPSDVDVHFQPAAAEAPEVTGPVERLRRTLAAGDLDGARVAHAELREWRSRITVAPQALRSFDRGLSELGDGLGPDAYWRAPTWKRLAAIAAGPGANVVLSLILFTILFATGGGRATTTVDSVVAESPAAAAGLRADDRIVAVDGAPVDASEVSERINASGGRPITLTVVRGGEQVRVGPVTPRLLDGRYRIGFILRGEGLGLA